MTQNSVDLVEKIKSLFDGPAFVSPLFYSYHGGLRFELSEGGAPLEQVLLALSKATQICEDVFACESHITVCLRKIISPNRFSLRGMLRELRLAGISIPRERCVWVEPLAQENRFEEQGGKYWCSVACNVPLALLQSLLWCAFARDFPVCPNPDCNVYLFNLHKKIIVYPYDDRGMDVVGLDHELLSSLYNKYLKYLLEYDRGMMDATFALN